jgi:hypothetical protein
MTHTPVDLTDEQRVNLATTPDLSKADSKDAKLTLTLKAKSGYSSVETHQISANQWSEILMICADAEMRAKMTAAPDLLEALDWLLTALRSGTLYSTPGLYEKADAAIAKATGYSSALAALNAETNEMVALSNGRLA